MVVLQTATTAADHAEPAATGGLLQAESPAAAATCPAAAAKATATNARLATDAAAHATCGRHATTASRAVVAGPRGTRHNTGATTAEAFAQVTAHMHMFDLEFNDAYLAVRNGSNGRPYELDCCCVGTL